MNIGRVFGRRLSRLPRSYKALIAIATLWCDFGLTAAGHPASAFLVGIVGVTVTVFLTTVPTAFSMRAEMANRLPKRWLRLRQRH